MVGLRSALTGLEAINEQNWTEEDGDRQLSRGLGIIHEARMEWNAARMKWPFLDCAEVEKKAENASVSSISTMGLWQACKIGLALTWPISLVLLVALGIFLIFVARRF